MTTATSQEPPTGATQTGTMQKSGAKPMRRKRPAPASRFKGLAWDKHEACWRVRVSLMGKQHHLGRCGGACGCRVCTGHVCSTCLEIRVWQLQAARGS